MISSFLSLAFLAITFPAVAPQPVSNDSVHAQNPIVTQADLPDSQSPVCYKIRSYIFERNDDAAPKLVRETTCSNARPHLNRSKTPQARIVPAN
jgi:hypothetical protein